MNQSEIISLGKMALKKEAEALAFFVDSIDSNFSVACEKILQCRGTVLLTGIGKSGLIARKWASTFASTGTKAYFINPAEASHGDLGVMHPQDLLISLSYSGETEELGTIVRHAKDSGVFRIAVTGNRESSLSKQSDLSLSVYTSEEVCPLNLAPTTSTTLMVALGDALAVSLMQLRGFTENDFARLHPGGSLGRRLWLKVKDLMHSGDSIPKVSPEDRWQNVLLTMTEKRLGLAVVMENERVLGVITDGDLRRFIQSGKMNELAKARDFMTSHPKFISENSLVVDAREVVEKNSVQQLLVQNDEGRLTGVIHVYDLLKKKVL
ncbi:MAG: SIS domain-containing protein [Pseudomonadota bacterium]